MDTTDTTDTTDGQAGDRPFGPDAATILATEHWSLLGTRSMIWNEAMSRTSIFLTVLSASIIALALVADATGFGSRTTTLALVLLPVVLLLGLATYTRLVEINTEETRTVLAMNRLRQAYLTIAPRLGPYFSTGHHDDARGLATTYLMSSSGSLRKPWPHYLVTTPTIVATIDAALAAAIVVLALQAVGASTAAVVAAGAVAFVGAVGLLLPIQRRTLDPSREVGRFPTPADEA
jgi:hypothetical protein